MGRDLAPLPARHLRAQPGEGIAGEIDGDTVATGSAAFMARLGWSVPPPLLPRDDDNRTAVFVGWTGPVRRLLLLAHTPPAAAPASVEAPHRPGIPTAILSGAPIGTATGSESECQTP